MPPREREQDERRQIPRERSSGTETEKTHSTTMFMIDELCLEGDSVMFFMKASAYLYIFWTGSNGRGEEKTVAVRAGVASGSEGSHVLLPDSCLYGLCQSCCFTVSAGLV